MVHTQDSFASLFYMDDYLNFATEKDFIFLQQNINIKLVNNYLLQFGNQSKINFSDKKKLNFDGLSGSPLSRHLSTE